MKKLQDGKEQWFRHYENLHNLMPYAEIDLTFSMHKTIGKTVQETKITMDKYLGHNSQELVKVLHYCEDNGLLFHVSKQEVNRSCLEIKAIGEVRKVVR